MRSQRAPRALALAILLTCALLARAADEGTLARTLPDEDAAEDAVGKTPLEVAKTEAVRELLREAEAAAEDAVLREAEDALKDEV